MRKIVITDNWGKEIAELEDYFSKQKLLLISPIQVNEYNKIINAPKFIASHLSVVKHNNGNRTFLPYLDRLFELRYYLQIQF